jgi:cell division protein FtsW
MKAVSKNSLNLPFLVCITVISLTIIGLLAIYSASAIPASQKTGSPLVFFQKQFIVALVGFAFLLFNRYIPLKLLSRLTLPIVVISLISLTLVFVPALQLKVTHFARWIQFFGFSIQPAEFAKIAVLLFLAKNLTRPSYDPYALKQALLPNLFVFFLFAALIMAQPDFGTTVLIMLVMGSMIIVSGVPRSFLVAMGAGAATLMTLAILLAPYRMKRLLTFLDPFAQVSTGGYQIVQSFLGFHNGGLTGLGLGESRQKLFFLPEADTDFILAVIAEELGLFGVLCVCTLFTYLIYLGSKIISLQTDPYKRMLAFGITSMIAIQAAINMGVAMGALPTKGIPLPFVSNGSNCLFVFLFLAAILAQLGHSKAPKESCGTQT